GTERLALGSGFSNATQAREVENQVNGGRREADRAGASGRWSRPARRSRAVGRSRGLAASTWEVLTCSQRDGDAFLHPLWQDDARVRWRRLLPPSSCA